uniref:Netrin receptor UNC5 n=2 Tax=Culicoides sonorensis TaxID=179676 RepID=A0A336KSV6_CULSO
MPVESLSDDFLFPMNTSRLSYASSPESDLEMGPGPSSSLSLGNLPALVKASSDPSIATNQDNLERDRDLGDGMGLMPPPYTNPYEHATAHQRRLNVESKYGFNNKGTNDSTDDLASSRQNSSQILGTNGSQGIYGAVPDLPPRIDRASKPPGGQAILPGGGTPGSSLPSRNSSSLHGNNSLGRSAHERLFGSKSLDHSDPTLNDEYASRSQLLGTADKRNGNGNSSLDRPNNSLDRQKPGKMGNSSYDSVSSYDSYSTSQLTPQTMRLGPNAPDDLKSVPNTNGRPPLTPNQSQEYRNSVANELMGSPRSSHLHQDIIGNRNSMHDRSGYNGDISSRSLGGHEPLTPRNSNERPMNMNIPQRPTNLGLDGPRKQMIDTKPEYGKYSRNNSTSQADYKSSPKAGQMGPPSSNGAPFKPVPPPKPKNYRPPVQGEPISPRSPNGFYYPPSSHHHYGQQQMQGTANGNQMNPNPGMHSNYGQYGGHMGNGYGTNGQQQPTYMSRDQIPMNGYNGNYGQNYGSAVPRGHPVPPVPAHHPSERRALDLAGSREQRGSAFELYRKPSIGAGVHHGMREMDRPPSQQQQIMFANANEYNDYQQYMSRRGPPPPSMGGQPALPPKPKKKLLRSPLTAIKNAFIKTTRPLRRQTSMNESDCEPKKLKSILKRQNSMMEPRMMNRQMYPMQDPYQQQMPMNQMSQQQQQYYMQPNMQGAYMPGHYPIPGGRHEPFYPNDSTYTNLEGDYGQYGADTGYYEQENIYANRARIELERRALPPVPMQGPMYGTNRLVRRHSLRDRRPGNYTPTSETGAYPKTHQYTEEPIYQSKRGSFLLNETRESARRFEESPYQLRKELHRNHLYQSKEEMQERIYQSRREFEKLSSEGAASPTTPTSEEVLEQKRREMKERGYRSKQQLREQIYQSRREAMESMAEPVYVSKRELKQETIYESKHEHTGDEGTPMKKDTSQYKFPPLPPPPKTPPPDPPIQTPVKDDSNDSTLKSSDATVISTGAKQDKAPLASIDSEEDEETIKKNNESDIEKALAAAEKIKVTSPLSRRAQPSHISNVIKRTAAPGGHGTQIYASRTSLETQYMSQASLPVGPPNAQSTPYASDLSIASPGAGLVPKKPWILPTVPREPMTTKGIFDSEGGKLEDNLWNVSLVIPKGAIPPGIKQEVYFTVSDPRMANQVGGPPLDMENGEAMLSPLVMCGPQGLEFQVPVILSIPHCAGATPSLGVSLKATDSEKNLRTDWDNIDLPSNAAASTVSVTVDHF